MSCFKEVLMLKTFFPLNNCSFDFSANLFTAPLPQEGSFDFLMPMRVHTPPTENKKCFAGLDGMWIHELLNFGALM